MIRVLFIRQNLPGQFGRPMRYLQTRTGYEVAAIGEETAVCRQPYRGCHVFTRGLPRLHLHPTYPFVASWSMLEAMAVTDEEECA